MRIGPAARLLLEQAHLTAAQVHGSGPHHIVTKGDVLAAVEAAARGGALPAQVGDARAAGRGTGDMCAHLGGCLMRGSAGEQQPYMVAAALHVRGHGGNNRMVGWQWGGEWRAERIARSKPQEGCSIHFC